MSSPTIAFNPGRGVAAMRAAEVEAEAAKAAKASRFKTNYLKIEKGEKAILRFITPIEKIPYVRYHNFVPTKPAPGFTTPGSPMSAACRRQPAFTNADGTPVFPDCWICDNKVTNSRGHVIKATPKMIAIACLRIWHDGRLIDMPREVEILKEDGTTEKKIERALVIVAQAPNNFWDLIMPMSVHNDGSPDTLSDRDFEITRQGGDTDTKYIPRPFDRDLELHPGNTQAWAHYLQAAKTQNLDPDRYVINQASDEYYARMFDPRYTVNDQGLVVPVKSGSSAPSAAAKQAAETEFERQIRELQESTAPAPTTAPAAAPVSADPWASGTDDEPGF